MYLDTEQKNCGNLCIVSMGIKSVLVLAEGRVAGNFSHATLILAFSSQSGGLLQHLQIVLFSAVKKTSSLVP